jgi:hypothetical protein
MNRANGPAGLEAISIFAVLAATNFIKTRRDLRGPVGAR